ncbi:hypothetical protein ACSBR2_015326 [Camellia fascicularis]
MSLKPLNPIKTNPLHSLCSKQPILHHLSPILHAVRNRRFASAATPKPLLIITPLFETHVSATILCFKLTGKQIKIHSGGHNYVSPAGVPFIIVDTMYLSSISLDTTTNTAWVQSGATLGELYFKIASISKTHGFPAGACSTVAVGGHLSCGGYGDMLRKYGLSVDNVLDARIVDVNGRVLDRKAMGEDLFWAVVGGGAASFAVVLLYKIRLVPVLETVTVFWVEKTLEQNATDIVYRWQFVAKKTDNDLFVRLLIQPTVNKQTSKQTIRTSFISLFLGDSNRLMAVMNRDFPKLGLQKQKTIPSCTDLVQLISDLKSSPTHLEAIRSYEYFILEWILEFDNFGVSISSVGDEFNSPTFAGFRYGGAMGTQNIFPSTFAGSINGGDVDTKNHVFPHSPAPENGGLMDTQKHFPTFVRRYVQTGKLGILTPRTDTNYNTQLKLNSTHYPDS